MKVKIKRLHDDAVIPKYAKNGDAGLDLVAVTRAKGLSDEGYLEYGTGLAVEIPEGFVGLIFPRSSISKTCLTLSNCVGVIDSGYRGEIKLRFNANGTSACCSVLNVLSEVPVLSKDLQRVKTPPYYKVGDKIGQLIIMPYPKVEFEEVEELSDSKRSTKGFGSTGN